MKRICSIVFVTAITFAAAHAQNGLSYAPSSPVTLPTFGQNTIIADAVGTSRNDLITAAYTQLVVYDQDAAQVQTIPAPYALEQLAVADLDGDGIEEFFGCGGAGAPLLVPGTVVIFKRVAGVLQTLTYAVPYESRVFARDMDQDGDVDLLCGLTILRNDAPSFAFTPLVPISTTGPAQEWEPGDFDGDGDVDLITHPYLTISGVSGWCRRIFRRDANGSFTLLGAVMLYPNTNPGFTAVGDLNGDGKDDVCMVNPYGVIALSTPTTCQTCRIDVVFGGAGFPTTLTTAYEFIDSAIGWPTPPLVLEDIDGDGDRDLAYGSNVEAPFLFLNDGTGDFAPPAGRLFETTPFGSFQHIGIGDADGDGDKDFVGLLLSSAPTRQFMTHLRQPDVPVAGSLILTGPPAQQILQNGQAVNAAFTVTHADGSPAPTQPVFLQITPVTTAPISYCPVPTPAGTTSASGAPTVATFNVGQPLLPGRFVMTATTATGTVATSIVDRVLNLTVVNGDFQSAAAGSVFNIPLTVQGGAGGTIVWNATGVPVSFVGGGNQTVADAQGQSSMEIRAGSIPGNVVVTATFGFSLVTFQLTVLPGHRLRLLDGDGQGATAGSAFSVPIRLRLEDASAQPSAGVPVTITPWSGLVTLSANAALTDAQGEVTFTAAAPANAAGLIVVRVATPVGTREVNLAIRKLVVSKVGPLLIATYQHEHAGVPLIVTFDVPLAPPGFQSTLYGDLYSTLGLAAPTVILLDGWGLSGPPDPTLVTGAGGSWGRFFPNVPVLNLNFVAQAIAYDPAYPFPDVVILSNPAPFSL